MIFRRAVTAVVVVALLTVLLSAMYLLSQGYRYFAVQSGSMEPTIRSGDLVIVGPPPADGSYSVGQIITFHPTPGYTTTHRIADISSDGIATKGDANATPDVSRIQPGQIAGVVTAVVPFGGYVAIFLQQPLAWVVVILGVALVFLVWELARMRQKPDLSVSSDPEGSA